MKPLPGKPSGPPSRCQECGAPLSATKVGRRLRFLGVGFRGATRTWGIRSALLSRLSQGMPIARHTKHEVENFLEKIGLTLQDVERPWPEANWSPKISTDMEDKRE